MPKHGADGERDSLSEWQSGQKTSHYCQNVGREELAALAKTRKPAGEITLNSMRNILFECDICFVLY